MKMLWFSAIALLLLPTLALAQIDPDPNGIGVYFDQGATQVATTATNPPIEVHAYLIATHCTLSGQVYYWDGYVATGDYESMMWGGPVAGQNIAMNMPGSNSAAFTVWIDAGEPFLVTPVLVLANLSVYLYTLGPHWLYVNGFHLAVTGAGGTSLYPSSGSEQRPVAVINGEMPVRNEAATWGGVKSLYSR